MVSLFSGVKPSFLPAQTNGVRVAALNLMANLSKAGVSGVRPPNILFTSEFHFSAICTLSRNALASVVSFLAPSFSSDTRRTLLVASMVT